jgi:EmrB/QacA subfamily drug resistance transporter
MTAQLTPALADIVSRRFLLPLLLFTQFLVVLLDTDVTVALPGIQRELGFSVQGLGWVQTAYMIGFGGLLLVGGRAADLYGRRRLLLIGLLLFCAGSLMCGLAPSAPVIVAGRAVQGVASAFASAAALSIITVTYPRGPSRDAALGAWGLVAGVAAVLGFLIGGVITEAIGWRWVFLMCVPLTLGATAATWAAVPPHPGPRGSAPLDLPGAILGTSTLAVLVLGISLGGSEGWGAAGTVAALVGAVVLGVSLARVEQHARSPLIPPRTLRLPNLVGGNVATVAFGAALLGMLILLALFLQEGRGYSPLQTGVMMVPVGLPSLLLGIVCGRAVGRYGFRAVVAAGLALLAGGAIALAAFAPGGAYATAILPGLILFGIGISATEVSTGIASTDDLGHGDLSGYAAGLWNTSLQVGGAIGVAVAASILGTHDHQPATAVVDGFRDGALSVAGFGLAGALLALAILRPHNRASVAPTEERGAGELPLRPPG